MKYIPMKKIIYNTILTIFVLFGGVLTFMSGAQPASAFDFSDVPYIILIPNNPNYFDFLNTTYPYYPEYSFSNGFQFSDNIQFPYDSYGNFYFNSVSGGDGGPDVETEEVDNIDEDEAELQGNVDMNDAEDGIVFFVYGQDEDHIEDIDSDYDNYDDIDDDDGDDFEVEEVDNNLDGYESYDVTIDDFEEDETYYVVLCVAYEDDDNNEDLECGEVEEFETDDDSSEKPDVEVLNPTNVDEDSAELRGEVDMNDFEDGTVFFVYGEDEDQVEDAAEEDTYNDIDEDGDDLRKIILDTSVDGFQSFEQPVYGLNENTDIYVLFCVAYEDNDTGDELECSEIDSFETE